MANTTLTADLILKEAKYQFKNATPFVSSLSRSYDTTMTAAGAKAGEDIRIRRPMKYGVRTGKVMDVQDNTETYKTLTKSIWKGIDLKFSLKELSLDINRFSDLYIKPAMSVLGSAVDQYCLTKAYKQVYNTLALPSTNFDRADVIAAKTMLTNFSTPLSSLYACVNPDTEGQLLNENASLFNPATSIGRQYTEGVMGKAYGFDFASSPNVASHTTGPYNGAHVVDGASQTGDTLTVKTGTGAPTEGDVFYIAGVYELNPVNQTSTGNLQKFTIGASASATSWPISPSIVVTGNQKTVSASPADDAVITEIGTASTAYPQNLFYNKDAFAVGFADLELPKGLAFAAKNVEDNIAMTIMRDFDIINADEFCRIDVLFGFETIIPEWAVRCYGI